MQTKYAIIRSSLAKNLYDVVKIDYVAEDIEFFEKGLTFEDAQSELKSLDNTVDIVGDYE